jgi:ATP-binding cassette subfamily F protein 3
MLQVSNIRKTFAGEIILDSVSFTINRGERAGLIGPNGCGKTTLLRIILGQEPPDSGSVRLGPGDIRVGYLAQALEYAPEATIDLVIKEAIAGLTSAELRVQTLAAAMSQATGAELDVILEAYDQALTEFERLGGYAIEARINAILDGLGLLGADPTTPVKILSGGQKTRLGLARLLLTYPDLLLLDEPTNHLDIGALQWLEQFVRRYDGAVIVVSHDRTFLDNTVNTILEIDEQTHRLSAYPGTYTDYVEAKETARLKHLAAYKEQQEFIQRMTATIADKESYARTIEHGTIDFATRKIAMGIARRMTVQRKRLERLLASEERLDKPSLTWQMKLDFGNPPESGREVLVLENVAQRFGSLELFREVNLTLRAGERVALIGPNGSGKTTLARLIAGQLTPSAGRMRLGAGVRLGYFAQEQDLLDPASTPLETVRSVAAMNETDVRSFLHFFLFAGDAVFTPVRLLSFGERARLALARLVALGCNFLLLDEPINHLDIPSRSRFEQALTAFTGTVLAIVHDRYFIEQIATSIWSLEDGTVRPYAELADVSAPRRVT